MGARDGERVVSGGAGAARGDPARRVGGVARREIRGLLLTHYAISALICTAATTAGIDPDRIKFKRAVRVIRRRARVALVAP